MSPFIACTMNVEQTTAKGVEGEPDEQLVAAAKADPRTFGLLYERYLNPIYRYCYNHLGNREAAEDATSEVFLKALANLERYRSGVFAAWLYTIARNVVASYHRTNHPSEPWERADRGNSEHDPGHLADVQEQKRAMWSALEKLPEEQRAALELPAAGWSDAQIAVALGKSQAAIRMIRYRAMERLRKLFSVAAATGGEG